MKLITLSSDYGYKDPHRAILHGVLAQLAPELRVLDLAHGLQPGNLIETAFVVANSFASYPIGTVHLILTSELSGSGVYLAMEMEGQFFIAPDNGVLSILQSSRKAKSIHKIEIGEQTKSLFPGRDFLAKAAVHLAQGGAASILGKPLERIKQASLPKPNVDLARQRIQGHIIYVDNFGNLITNLSRKDLNEVLRSPSIEINLPRNRSLDRISSSYQDIGQDGVLALINSLGLLEIAYRDMRSQHINGASSLLGLNVMNEITINYE